MSTLIEESPDYPARVTAYLAKTGRQRMPWGTVLTGDGKITYNRVTAETSARHDKGETAISLLLALGVSEEMLEQLTAMPWDSSPEELIAKLQTLREE